MARTKEYVKKGEGLEKFIRDNRLVSKEAQMNQMMGEGYRDPRFIATTGNKNLDHWGLHPLAAEGSGQVLSTKMLGMAGEERLVDPATSGTYDPNSDTMRWKDMRGYGYKADKDDQPEFTQIHEIIHRASKLSGYREQREDRLKDKLPTDLQVYGRDKYSPLTEEILAHGLQHKLSGGNVEDKKLRDQIKFRVSKYFSDDKTKEKFLAAMPFIVEDFETYLEELDTESYKAGGLIMNYGDYGRNYK